ncbi:hypothetical protein AAHC03_012909 [Spirometra sp. Aus1]
MGTRGGFQGRLGHGSGRRGRGWSVPAFAGGRGVPRRRLLLWYLAVEPRLASVIGGLAGPLLPVPRPTGFLALQAVHTFGSAAALRSATGDQRSDKSDKPFQRRPQGSGVRREDR